MYTHQGIKTLAGRRALCVRAAAFANVVCVCVRSLPLLLLLLLGRRACGDFDAASFGVHEVLLHDVAACKHTARQRAQTQTNIQTSKTNKHRNRLARGAGQRAAEKRAQACGEWESGGVSKRAIRRIGE